MKSDSTKKVFISYKSRDERSEDILEQLVFFFNKWGLECKPVERIEDINSPKSLINEELSKSHYFIQIFNRQKYPSKWMIKEWELAVKYKNEDKNMRMLAAFYTAETPIKEKPFKEYVTARNKGEKRIINIDKEKRNAGTMIQAILINAGTLNKTHGEIKLPDFCNPPRNPSDINLKSFEDFIDNFRHAYDKGLSKIYPDKDKPTEWIVDRLNKMKDGETVRMLGFTLNRFVYPKNKKGIGDEFKDVLLNRNCKAELIILDRQCDAAKDRIKIESPKKKYRKSLLYVDNRNVEKYYSKKIWKNKITIKKYDAPYMGMVIFNDMILVEIYHLGNDGEEEVVKNICGRVPVFFIRKGTSFYNLFKSHFNRVWKMADNIKSKNTLRK